MTEKMEKQPIQILIVDDDPALLAVLEAGLQIQDCFHIAATSSATEALSWIEQRHFDLVVTDYALEHPDITGLTLLRTVSERDENTLVVLITAYASLEITLESMHLGAYDFLTKPFQLDELQLVVRNATDRIDLERENQWLHEQVGQMATALERIEKQHHELLERIRRFGAGYAGAESSRQIGNRTLPETQRHTTEEQIAMYLRMGETIFEQLARERRRIDTLFEKGLLPEHAYRRAMKDRFTDPPGRG